MRSLWEIIESLQDAKSVDDIISCCTRYGDLFGFDKFLYGAYLPRSLTTPERLIISTYQEEWLNHYDASGYEGIDPVVAHCLGGRLGAIGWAWQDLPRHDYKCQQFWHEADDFHLSQGFSLPLHGGQGDIGLVSFATGASDKESQKRIASAIPYSHFFSSHLHEAVRRLNSWDPGTLHIDISEREKECLLWASEGKTAWETSRIIGVAESTVIFHLRNATRKLNAVNKQQAIARAIVLGIIRPTPY